MTIPVLGVEIEMEYCYVMVDSIWILLYTSSSKIIIYIYTYLST